MTAPTVAAVAIDDGSAQRSRITSLTVTFSAQVTFAGTVASAFTLTAQRRRSGELHSDGQRHRRRHRRDAQRLHGKRDAIRLARPTAATR